MMTWQTAAQDAFVYAALVAVALLYSRSIEYQVRQREESHEGLQEIDRRARRIASTFRAYCILVASGLMLSGVLYQFEVISRVVMAGLFAVCALACVFGLIRLRRYLA